MTTPAESTAAKPSIKGRLYDLINVPLLGLVFLMFFLPQVKLSCGDDVHVKFSGPSLTLGTDPSIEGVPAGERREQKRDYSLNPLFLTVPIGAIAGAVLFYRASQRPVVETSWLQLWKIPAVIVIILASYGMFGFGVEREFARQMDKGEVPRDVPIKIGKTGWYFVEFLFAAGALGLALMRRGSPDVEFGAGKLQIVPGAPPAAPPQNPD